VHPLTIGAGTVRATATVTRPDEVRDLWFSLPEPHQSAVAGCADPFVLASLLRAMHDGSDLLVRGAPVSPSLCENLHEWQVAWHAWRGYPVVDVGAETVDEWGVGRIPRPRVAAFSGGVDSAFTVYQHRATVAASVMAHGFDIPLDDPAGFEGARVRSERMLASIDVPLIPVVTNLRGPDDDWNELHGLALGAVLTLLGGTFAAGMVASSASYEDLVLPWGSNPVTDHLMGSESFRVVHTGAGVGRFEKLRVLTGWDEAMRWLRFCWVSPQRDVNCGRCGKCVLVALSFRVLGLNPACFASPVTDEAIETILRSRRPNPFSARYGRQLLAEADTLGVNDPWVGWLRERIRWADPRTRPQG